MPVGEPIGRIEVLMSIRKRLLGENQRLMPDQQGRCNGREDPKTAKSNETKRVVGVNRRKLASDGQKSLIRLIPRLHSSIIARMKCLPPNRCGFGVIDRRALAARELPPTHEGYPYDCVDERQT